MATFVLLSTLTDDGAKTIKSNPARIKEVNAELEKMGAKVINQWLTLGLYDFVNIVEAPDNLTMAKISAELSSRGSIRVMTMAAIPMDEFIASVTR